MLNWLRARLACLDRGHLWWIEGCAEQHGFKVGTRFCIRCTKLHPSEKPAKPETRAALNRANEERT